MKTKILSVALGYIIIFSCTSISKQKDASDFIKKHKLENINPVFVIAIESSECQKCKIAITGILKWAKENNKNNHLVFLPRGLRQAEINYFAQTQLNISADSFRFIADDGLYAELNKDLVTSLIIIRDGKIEKSLSIYEGVNYLFASYSKKEYELILSDSAVLDESKIPISKQSQIALVNDSQIVLIDPQYANLSIYNINSGKQEKTCRFNYNYESLYRLSDNSGRVKNINETRDAIRKEGMQELNLKYLYVDGTKIYITAQISLPASSNIPQMQDDIGIRFNDFLIITDTSFQKQEYIYLSEAFGRDYFFVDYYPFTVLNREKNQFLFSIGKIFIDPQTGMPSRKKEYKNLPFLASLTLDTITKKFSPLKVSERTLPLYFEENKLGYNLTTIEFCRKDSSQYYYFTALPYLYNINSDEVLNIPDTSYQFVKIDGQKQGWWNDPSLKDMFVFSKLNFAKNNDIAYLAYFKQKMYFVVCNPATGQIKYKTGFSFIPRKNFINEGQIITDKELYVISSTQEHTMLYKFQYVN